MTAFKTFAVAGGTGDLGGKLVKELAAAGFHVKVLTRSSSPVVAPGAEGVTVDLASEESLASALAGVDVAINALGQASLQTDAEKTLARAAKTAGVKLYVPNSWGADIHRVHARADPPLHPFIFPKLEFPQWTEKELQLPLLNFNVGVFSNFLAPLLSIDKGAHTATIVGKGDTTFSSTSPADIARFAARAFATLPASELLNKSLNVAGSSSTVNELLAAATARDGQSWTVTHTPVEEAERVSKDLSLGVASFFTWLLLSIEKGSAEIASTDHARVGFEPQDSAVDALLA